MVESSEAADLTNGSKNLMPPLSRMPCTGYVHRSTISLDRSVDAQNPVPNLTPVGPPSLGY